MKNKVISVLFFLVLTVVLFSFTGCTDNKDNTINEFENTEVTKKELEEEKTIKEETSSEDFTDEEMYGDLIEKYKKAVKDYDLEDFDIDDKIKEKYEIVDTTLLMHIAHYSNNGVELTYSFYDIDKNGVNELLLGASDSVGAIYSFDKNIKQPVSIFFQSTLERGSLQIYDNGVILSEGSGGAMLHYYEFGKLNGTSYELLESIEEEYTEEGKAPTYKDAKTGKELSYKSLDEITNKYISDAKEI